MRSGTSNLFREEGSLALPLLPACKDGESKSKAEVEWTRYEGTGEYEDGRKYCYAIDFKVRSSRKVPYDNAVGASSVSQ